MESKLIGDRVYLDWFAVQNRTRLQRYLSRSSGSASDFFEFLSPLAEAYHLSLNPIFLAECVNLEDLARARVWLARDGLVPLLWFFSRYPEPGNFRGKILVHEEFAFAVPIAWMERAGTYRHGALPVSRMPENCFEYNLAPRDLILFGISAPSYCELPELERQLETAAQRFRDVAGREPERVFLCMIRKTEPLRAHEEMGAHSTRAVLAVAKRFGTQVEAIDPDEIEKLGSLRGFAVAELNQRSLLADPLLMHTMIGKGAVPLDPPLDESYDTYVRTALSFGFGLRGYAPPGQKSRVPSAFEVKKPDVERKLAAINSPANLNFPWPQWFEDVGQMSLETSGFTSCPSRVAQGIARFPVGSRVDRGWIDRVALQPHALDIHGWCLDLGDMTKPCKIVAFAGGEELHGRLSTVARPDVWGAYRIPQNERKLRPGFLLRVPVDRLDRAKMAGGITVLAIASRGVAHLIGHFSIPKEVGGSWVNKVLPGTKFGGNHPCSIDDAAQRFTLMAEGDAQPTRQYRLWNSATSTEEYEAFVDTVQQTPEGRRVMGWAANLASGSVPEAIAVVSPRDLTRGTVFAAGVRRDDVSHSHGPEFELSGFEVTVDQEPAPRIFVLFEAGVAIEVSGRAVENP